MVEGRRAVEMRDHRLLIGQDRVPVAQPELSIDRVLTGRADHHDVGHEPNCLLGLDGALGITLHPRRPGLLRGPARLLRHHGAQRAPAQGSVGGPRRGRRRSHGPRLDDADGPPRRAMDRRARAGSCRRPRGRRPALGQVATHAGVRHRFACLTPDD